MIPANQTFPFLGPYTPGIDVSHFQGSIDWAQVKASGIQFAYLKATDGATGRDPMFDKNAVGCLSAGIPFGAYHFFRPSEDPEAQAHNFLFMPLVRATLPPALDVEISPVTIDQIQHWLSLVEDGYPTPELQSGESMQPIIYCSPAFARQFLPSAALGDGFFDEYALWVAEYTSKPAPDTAQWKDWEFWQYSANGRIAGISTPVDLDWFHGTVEDLKARFSIKST